MKTAIERLKAEIVWLSDCKKANWKNQQDKNLKAAKPELKAEAKRLREDILELERAIEILNECSSVSRSEEKSFTTCNWCETADKCFNDKLCMKSAIA